MNGRPLTASLPSTYARSSAGDLPMTGCGPKAKRWLGIPFCFAAARARCSNALVWMEAVGTPYSVSRMKHWPATAGAQVLQWPTATTAASPRA